MMTGKSLQTQSVSPCVQNHCRRFWSAPWKCGNTAAGLCCDYDAGIPAWLRFPPPCPTIPAFLSWYNRQQWKSSKNISNASEKRWLYESNIDRIKAPIGLPIGLETPEEIAVSIAAQLIRERYEGN